MVSSSFAFALASPVLPPFRVSGVPQRGHLHLLGILFSLNLCCSQLFKLGFAKGHGSVHFPLVKLKTTTPITIKAPPAS